MADVLKTGTSYFGNRILKYVEQDMKGLKQGNCNLVVHVFSENDLQYYSQTMKEMVTISHEQGLEVYMDPWGVGQVFGGEAYSSFLYKNLGSWQVTSQGNPAPIACLNDSVFNDFMKSWVEKAVETGTDVVFWDEPHWYLGEWFDRGRDEWGCLCKTCRALFCEAYGYEMPTSLSQVVLEFREKKILDFLDRMASYVKKISGGKVRNAVCLLPVDDPRQGFMDWGKVCALPVIDVIGTDPYWISFERDCSEFVGAYSRKVVDLCARYQKEGQIWIQAYRIPKGREKELAQAVQVAYDAGVRNLAAWSLYACDHMSYLRSDDSPKVWETLLSAYGKLHDAF